LARAAYSLSEVVLLDDSLSALDAYVGQSIVDKCILTGPLAGRTRILVTHALHVLEKTDHVYIMDDGMIIEHGTYDVGNILLYATTIWLSDIKLLVQTLMKSSVAFAHLIDEYGSHENVDRKATRKNTRKPTMHPNAADKPDAMKLGSALIQSEERLTGSVPWVTYIKYFRFAGTVLWIPAIIILVLLSQAASGEFTGRGHVRTSNNLPYLFSVGNNLFLGFWTSHTIHGFSEGNYMAVYAALGIVQALFAFFLSYALAYVFLIPKRNSYLIYPAPQICRLDSQSSNVQYFFPCSALFTRIILRHHADRYAFTLPDKQLIHIIHSGRMLSRLSKDQDILDTELTSIMSQVRKSEQYANPLLTFMLVLV
jgi:ATP-binding cassette, subfamily C (CFTR/MRP), member 1